METARVVVAGHVCLDLTPKFPEVLSSTLSELLVPGSLLNVGECVLSTGGPLGNTGMALARLGERPSLMGRVGDDVFGAIVRDMLKRDCDAEGVIVVPGQATSYTVVLAPPGVDRIFLHNPGANGTFCANDIDYARLQAAAAFHLGYPPLLARMFENCGDSLVSIYREAKQRGVTTSLDMSLPDPESEGGRADWAGILQRVLPYVDLFLPSIEEVLFCVERRRFLDLRARSGDGSIIDLLGPRDFERLGDRLLSWGAGVVVIKSGHRGLYARSGDCDRIAAFGRERPADPAAWANREIWQAPFVAERVVSATGAGDCAIAGFLKAFLERQDMVRALQCAAAAGALNVTKHDSVSGLVPYPELLGRLKTMECADLHLNSQRWQPGELKGLWFSSRDAAFTG